MHTPLRFCVALGLLLANASIAHAKAILQGTVSFLNSKSRPAVGVKISAFGATGVYSDDAGMFRLEFSSKVPGDKVNIIIGSNDKDGVALELVNVEAIAQLRIPSNPEEDIVEIIVCKVGQRNDAALRYNGLIVKTIIDNYEKILLEINQKINADKIDAKTIVSLQNEKEKLAAERDSALAKAEEQALYIASINLDKASQLVKDAVMKVDSLRDIAGAIAVLDNEILYQAYLDASEKKKKAEGEIQQVVAGFEFKIKLLEPLGRYADIVECYEKIAGIYKKEDYDKEKLVICLYGTSYYQNLNGDYQKELEANLEALSTRKTITSVDHQDLAISYNNLAWSYIHLGKYQKALEFNQKAYTILKKILPENHPNLAKSYNNMGVNYGHLGEYQKALTYYLKALEIQEKVLSEDDPDLASSYNNLADTYGHLSKYQEALDFNLKAMGIWGRTLDNNHPYLAISCNNLADIYSKQKQHQKALEFNLKALVIREKILPKNHPDLALSYNNLAVTYVNLGDYQKAKDFNLKALSIQEKVLLSEHPDLVSSYVNLATTYSNLGEYQKSLALHQKALSIREKILSPNHPDLAISFNNVAWVYAKLGDYQKSLEFNLKCLSIRKKILRPDDPNLAVSYSNIGLAYAKLHQFRKAKEYFGKFQEVNTSGHVFRNWAMYYALQNNKTRALENLQKAVSLGYKDLKWIETDDSLESIRGEQGYKEIVEQLKKGQ